MTRNIANPKMARIHVCSPQGATSKGIQVPTNSSILTARGSLPQYLSITFEVHTPMTVVAIMSVIVTERSVAGGKKRYNRYHIPNAANAPAVPGAMGINPVPIPVESMTCNNGASPIL